MSLYNDLVQVNFPGATDAELMGIENRAECATGGILSGLSAVGNLMFWASDNPNYSGEMAKADMYSLGEMLTVICDVTRALGDTAANAAVSKNSIESKGGAHE